MPAGVPVATVGVGNARNAGLLAVRILAVSDAGLRERLAAFQDELRETAETKGECGPQRVVGGTQARVLTRRLRVRT